MIYLKLFLTFLEIGALSFGGGYGMLSLIRDKVMLYGWLTEEELLNLVAVSESTPGPIAINMATFVGSEQGGFWGAACATVGVILPSFFLVLIIVAFIKNLLKYGSVAAFLKGVQPAVVGLIVATAVVMLLSNLMGIRALTSASSPDLVGIAIFALLATVAIVYKKLKGKSVSPILLLLLSAGIGILEGVFKN